MFPQQRLKSIELVVNLFTIMPRVQLHQQQSTNMKKGAWSPEEDQKLKSYIMKFGIWNWSHMPKFAGLFSFQILSDDHSTNSYVSEKLRLISS